MSETNSMASSQRTIASSRVRVGMRIFSTSFPIFPVFMALESDYHLFWSYIGIAIQFIQFLGFVINPRLNHGETLHYLSYPIYATHVPLWDSAFIRIPYIAYLVLWGLGVAWVISFYVFFLHKVITKKPAVRYHTVFVFLRLTLHGCTSVCLIPLAQGFFSQMVCYGGALWTYPNQMCFTAASSPIFVFSILGFALLAIMAFVSDTTMFSEAYNSPHPLSRKHNTTDIALVVWKLLAVMLFHLLLSNSTRNGETYFWFAMAIALSALIMTFMYAFLLPFVHQSTNRIFTIMFLIEVVAGTMVYFSAEAGLKRQLGGTYADSVVAKMDLDGLLFFAFGCLSVVIGWSLADARINKELLESLPQVVDSSAPFPKEYSLLYPKGLPDYDALYTSAMDLCNEVADGAFVEGRSHVSLEIPYLRRIVFHTDVEVSTRFIPLLEKITGHLPTKEMLHLAARIYVKATYRFNDDGDVIVSFAALISEYTSKPSLALSQCDRTSSFGISVSCSYRAYRLLYHLKKQLRLRDAGYQNLCEGAKRAHKDILVRLQQFWHKLASQHDYVQLQTSFSAIAQRRRATNSMFISALQHQNCDRDLLLKYADFVEQVLMEKTAAEKIRRFAYQEIDKQNGNAGSRAFGANSNEAGYDRIIRQNRASQGTVCGIRIDCHIIWKILTVFALLCVGIIFVLLLFFTRYWEDSTLDCIENSGTARTLRITGDLVALQFWSTQEHYPSSGARLNAISAISQDMLYIHDFLTGGLPRASSPARAKFFTSKLVVDSFYSGSSVDHTSTSFMGLGYHYATHLNDIAGVIARTNSQGSSNEAIFTEQAAAKASLVDSNGAYWGSNAYNASVQSCKQWHQSVKRNILLLFSLLYFTGVLLIVMFVQLSTMVSPVEKLKTTIITLVTLIPSQKVAEIEEIAKKKVELFDSTQGADDDNFQLQETEVEAEEPLIENREEEEVEVDKKNGTLNTIQSDDGAEDRYENELEREGDITDPEKQQLIQREETRKLSRRSNANREKFDSERGIAGISHSRTNSFRFGEVFIYILCIAFLVAAVVFSFWSVQDNTSKIYSSNVVSRVNVYKEAEMRVFDLNFAVSNYFATGFSKEFEVTVRSMERFRRALPMTLTLSPNEFEVDNLVVIAKVLDDSLQLLPALILFSYAPSGVTSQWDPITNTVPTNPMGEGARLQLYGGVSSVLMRLFPDTLESMDNAVATAGNTVSVCVEGSNNRIFMILSLSCSACVLVCGGLSALYLFTVTSSRRTRNVMIALFSSIISASLIVILGGVSYGYLAKLESTCRDYLETEVAQIRGVQSCFEPLFFASVYVQQGLDAKLLLILTFFDFLFEHPYDEFVKLLKPDIQEKLEKILDEMIMLEKIALSLVASANFQFPMELQSFTWDFDAEPDAMWIRLEYPDDYLRYSTKAFDTALPNEHKVMIARNIVSNERMNKLIATAFSLIEENFESEKQEYTETAESSAKKILVMQFVCLGLTFFTLIAFIAFLFLQVHARLSTLYGKNQLVIVVKAEVFAEHRLRIMALLLFALLTIAFALCMMTTSARWGLGNQIDLLTARSFYTAASMNSIELWVSESIPVESMKSQLDFYYREMDNLRSELSNSVYNLFAPFDDFLLKPNAELSETFRYGYNGGDEPDNSDTAFVFPKGLENAVAEWMQKIVEVSENNDSLSYDVLITSMRSSLMKLLRGLDMANHMLLDLSREYMNKYVVVEVCLMIAYSFVVLALIPLLLVPESIYYTVEEAGYRMLVKLIPNDVKESIPAMRSFIAQGFEENFDVSSATDEIGIPTIAINTSGIVTHFNRSAEEAFGYAAAEVIGNNVSILMPDQIAQVHDTYLHKYKNVRPVNRMVYRDRELQGKRKNNEHFPLRLTVNEVYLRDDSRSFIGFPVDISEHVVQSRNEELSRYVQEYLMVPMIAIDSLGTVLRFNRAAEECFGRSSSEVLESNVKILMPEDIANRHDTFLATYLRTREKHAINNLTRTRAIRKNGTEFPIEIMVRENFSHNVFTYFGFVRDLSADQELEMATAISDTILSTSVIPIICTDMYGRIVSFSSAAEKAFGYAASEVMDQNCKILMPEMVADRHDEYLEQYRTSWSKRASSIVDRSLIGRHKEGHLVPLFASIHEVKTSSANNAALVGFFRELAEVRMLENSLDLEQIAAEYHRTPLIVANRKGVIIQANRSALLEFGYVAEELIGNNLGLLMPPDIAEKHNSFLARYAETGVGSVVNNVRRFRAKRRNGTYFTIELSVREVRHEDGEPTYIGFLRNIEKEVRMGRQEAINDAILAHPMIPLVAVNEVGKAVLCNEAAERLLHYRSGELVGVNMETFLPNPLLSGRSTGDFSFPLDQLVTCDAVTFDAATVPVRALVKMVSTSPPHYLVLIRDTYEEGLSELKKLRIKGIEDGVPVPMIEFDAQGIVTAFNPAAEKQLQWKRDEAIGSHLRCFLKDSEVLVEIFKVGETADYSEEYGLAKVFQTQAKTKNGRLLPVEFIVSEVEVSLDVERRSKFFISCFTNISENAEPLTNSHLDLNPQPIITISKFGVIISCNVALVNLFRFGTAHDLIGQNVNILMPPEVSELHDGYLIAYSKTRIKKMIDSPTVVKAKRADGTYFPALLTVREMKDDYDTYFMGTITDDSSRVELADAHRVTQALKSLSPRPLFVFDKRGVICEVNEAACEVFSYDAEKLLKISIEKVLPGLCTESGQVLPRLTDLSNPLTNHRKASTGKRADGSTFDVDVILTVTKINTSPFIVACVTDLSQSHALLGQRMLNTSIADRSPVPIIIIDGKGTIKLFSGAAEEFYGYISEEVVGSNMQLLMPPEEAAKQARFLSTVANSEKFAGRTSERLARLKSGEWVPVTLVSKPIPLPHGKAADYVGFMTDRRDKFKVERARNLAQSVEQSMPLPYVITTGVGVILDANAASETFFGFTVAELRGEKLSSLISARISDVTEPITLRSVKVTTKMGETKVADMTACALIDPQNPKSSLSRIGVAFSDCCASNEFHKAKQRIDHLLDFAHQAVVFADIKTLNITEMSEEAKKLLKCRDSSIYVGTSLKKLITDPEAFECIMQSAQGSSGDFLGEEIVTRMHTFSDFVFFSSIVAESNSEELMLWIRSVADTRTEMLNTAFLNGMQAVAPDPFVIVNEDDDIAFFSEGAKRLLGYVDHDLLPQRLIDDSFVSLFDSCKEKVKEVLSVDMSSSNPFLGFLSDPTLGMESAKVGVDEITDTRGYTTRSTISVMNARLNTKTSILAANGRVKYFDVRFSEICLPENVRGKERRRYIIVYLLDEEEKRREANSIEILASTVENCPSAICVIDTTGTVLRFNSAAEKMFRFERSQIIGKKVDLLMAQRHAARHDTYIQHYLRTREKRVIGSTREVIGERKNGEQFPILLSMSEVLEEGEPMLFVGCMEEIPKSS